MQGNKEPENRIEIKGKCSMQFLREVIRMKGLIKQIVMKNYFSKSFGSTENLRVNFNNTVERMEENEKDELMRELVTMVYFTAPVNPALRSHYEQVVNELFQDAFTKGVFTRLRCVEGLIMTTDFNQCRVDQTKWKFIQECVPKIGYQGVRRLLRNIIEYQFRRLPKRLTPEQMNKFRIVEDIALNIIDRQSDLLPPLMVLSEINRELPIQAYMFPRLIEKLANLSINFKPIADLSHVCGASFLYPIPLHPSFSPHNHSWEESGVKSISSIVQAYHTRPYRPVNQSGNLYMAFMILNQPMGKDSFHQSFKLRTKPYWDILITVLVVDAMAAVEGLPEDEPIPRYQWDNLVNIVIFGIDNNLLNPKNFFKALKELIACCNYKRARHEIMWIVLQVVSSLNNFFRFDNPVLEITELYQELFRGGEVWMGAFDHPAEFARYFAAASAWMLLEKEFRDKMPEANNTIKLHMKFIQNGAENFDKNNTAMLAVLVNTLRIDNKMGKLPIPALAQLIECADESNPIFELSYRRTAVNSFSPVPQEFLDALTFRSKRSFLHQCLSCLRTFTADKLPGPSVLETIARICQSEDFELAVKEVEVLAQRYLNNFRTTVDLQEPCAVLLDFLVYRLPHLPAFFKYNSPMTNLVLASFTRHFPNNPQNHQIYRLKEQFLMRRWCWTGFYECIANLSNFLPKKDQETPLTRRLLHPKSFTKSVSSMNFPMNPEVFKMSLYTLLRAMHITGHEVMVEESTFPHLIAGYGWPKKSTHCFPKWALDIIETKDLAYLQPNFEEIVHSVDEAVDAQKKLTQHQFLLKYGDDSDISTLHSLDDECPLLAIIFKLTFDSLETDLELTPDFFELVDRKTPKEIVIMGNYMVDYIIAFAKKHDHSELLFKNIAKACARVVFEFQVMRADRLLLALTMHPATDEDALLCVQIANEFLLTSELQERIKWFHNNNVLRKESAPTEYLKAIVKYHDMYPEFEACQLVTKNEMKANVHMPNYYGSLIERLLPILDHWMYVALDQQGYKLSPHVLQVVAMFYRYHPMPIHFMYTILFTSHGKMSRPEAKSFVLKFMGYIDEVHLTEAFVKFNHQKSSKESVVMELLDRMAASLDFVLVPPSFVAKDWKTAELSPGAQTLYLACIELMASPHSPEDMVAAMINLMQMKPHLKPYNVVNLIALLLTALPSSYAAALHQEFFDVLERGETEELKFEEIVFDTFEEYQLVNITSRTRSLNVISQAYWTHCNLSILKSLSGEHVPKLLEHVKTEKDLWYFLRLVVPIISRYWQNLELATEMRTQGNKFGPLIIVKQIIEKMGRMTEKGVELKYQAHICDYFYNCKYLFADNFLKETANTAFAKYPEEIRNRLKFYMAQAEQQARISKSTEKKIETSETNEVKVNARKRRRSASPPDEEGSTGTSATCSGNRTKCRVSQSEPQVARSVSQEKKEKTPEERN